MTTSATAADAGLEALEALFTAPGEMAQQQPELSRGELPVDAVRLEWALAP